MITAMDGLEASFGVGPALDEGHSVESGARDGLWFSIKNWNVAAFWNVD
jgi:hypothetical protein